MPTIHVVAQGEQLSGIAEQYGYLNFEGIWNATENEALRQQRHSPHALLPGDQVVIPEKTPKPFDRAVDSLHEFQVHREKALLKLRLCDVDGEPLANAECELTVEGVVKLLVADGDGRLEAPIPRSAHQVSLAVNGLTYSIAVGHLDPAGSPSGCFARLKNLGYLDCAPDAVSDEEGERAITAFQREENLEVTGTMDEQTCGKLLERHGS